MNSLPNDHPGRVSRALSRHRGLLGIYTVLLVVVVVSVGMRPEYRDAGNLTNIMRQLGPLFLLAVGQTFVVISGGFDLSIGMVMTFCSALMAGLVNFQNSRVFPAAIAVLAVGAVAGVLNATIIFKLRISPLVTTLGTMAIWYGLVFLYTGGAPMKGVTRELRQLNEWSIAYIPGSAFLVAAGVIVAWVVLRKTVFGRGVYAVGGNQELARLAGVKVFPTLIGTYVVSGLMAALAGIYIASRTTVGDPYLGVTGSWELLSIAAVVMGGTYILGGKGGIAGTLAGVLVLGLINNTMNYFEVQSYWQMVVRGLVIVIVMVAYSSSRRK